MRVQGFCAFQDKVGSRTLEGRRLRRHVLKGAVIVFITAGYSGKRFIFEKVGQSASMCLQLCLHLPGAQVGLGSG